MALIYIVEDDKNIQEIESYALSSAGYDVRCFDDGAGFSAAMKSILPDRILLDIMLPAPCPHKKPNAWRIAMKPNTIPVAPLALVPSLLTKAVSIIL